MQTNNETMRKFHQPVTGKLIRRRSSLLLDWLKDPRNQFMFWRENKPGTIGSKLENKDELTISNSLPVVTDSTSISCDSVSGSSESDIWDVSSVDTPTVPRKAVSKSYLRKAVSLKHCNRCKRQNKANRRHESARTPGEMSRDLANDRNDSNRCFRCKQKLRSLSFNRSISDICNDKRDSCNDSDSGVTELDYLKSAFSTGYNDSSGVPIPLDEVERKRERSCSLIRSKSEGHIPSSSTFVASIYNDNDNSQNMKDNERSTPTLKCSNKIAVKGDGLRYPRFSDRVKDETHIKRRLGHFKSKSVFDVSGKDPFDEANIFFGVQTSPQTLRKRSALGSDNLRTLSKSCSNISSVLPQRKFVLKEQSIDENNNCNQASTPINHLRSFSHPRRLRRQLAQDVNAGNYRRFGKSLDEKLLNRNRKFDSTVSIEALRQELKSLDIKDALKLGSNVTDVDQWGNTLLHYAAAQGDSHLIESILQKGGSVWTPNIYGHLPLDFVSNFKAAAFLSHSTLFYGHGSNMANQGHLQRKCIHYEL